MTKIFLYRLFKESKIFFLFTVAFIIGYAIVLSKQMDMLIFPINSMFSNTTAKDFSTSTYAIILNGKLIKITEDLYLKKDFSENSLQVFSKWIKADRKNLMTELLERRIADSTKRILLLTKLTPPKQTVKTWPIWFLKFHHIKINAGDNIEIWEYKLNLEKNQFSLKDSALITKQIVINE